MIPSTLERPGAAGFWLAVILTGIGAGIAAAAALTQLLELYSTRTELGGRSDDGADWPRPIFYRRITAAGRGYSDTRSTNH